MDFNLSDEEMILRDNVSRFVSEEYGPGRPAQMAAQRRGNWARFAELGWLGVGIPEEAGGYDASLGAIMIIAEGLGRAPALEPYIGGAVLAPQAVLAATGAEAAADLTTPIIEGSIIVALANGEHDARGQLAWTAAAARRTGEGFVLNGEKTAVLGGPLADMFLVAARTASDVDSSEGITLFRVPRDAPGLSIRDYRLIDGGRASDLRLEGVDVGDDALVGAEGKALPAIEVATDIAIVASAFSAVGAMGAALALTQVQLRTRMQFGKPLRDFQVLRHRAADMVVQLEQARSAAYRGLAGLYQQDRRARAHAVSAAKIVVSRASHFVCGQAIQLHGGMGVTDELRVSHLFKHVTVLNALFGTEAHHAKRLGALM